VRAPALSVIVLAGCLSQGSASEADAGSDAASDVVYDVKSEPPTYINPSCPVSFSAGCAGSGDGGCPPYHCIALPPECENNLTCACVSCADSTCGNHNCLPPDANPLDDLYVCSFDGGTFTVECINP